MPDVRHTPLHLRRVRGLYQHSRGLGVPDAYILLPYAGFFEFLPVDARVLPPLTVGELELGGSMSWS
ncbi:MAG: hypothetical protein ACLUEK_00195 [Oscillospiraceae bacterium]